MPCPHRLVKLPHVRAELEVRVKQPLGLQNPSGVSTLRLERLRRQVHQPLCWVAFEARTFGFLLSARASIEIFFSFTAVTCFRRLSERKSSWNATNFIQPSQINPDSVTLPFPLGPMESTCQAKRGGQMEKGIEGQGCHWIIPPSTSSGCRCVFWLNSLVRRSSLSSRDSKFEAVGQPLVAAGGASSAMYSSAVANAAIASAPPATCPAVASRRDDRSMTLTRFFLPPVS